MEEYDEIVEGYIERYRLDDGLPKGHKKQAVFLITTLRDLKRLRFSNFKDANHAHQKASRWLVEKQVFARSEHTGYNALLSMVGESLEVVRKQIEEKFAK